MTTSAGADLRDLDLRGNECQCTACGRIFGGLEGFDAHQQWRGAGDKARLTCVPPDLVKNHRTGEIRGYVARNRRGREVWVLPEPA